MPREQSIRHYGAVQGEREARISEALKRLPAGDPSVRVEQADRLVMVWPDKSTLNVRGSGNVALVKRLWSEGKS